MAGFRMKPVPCLPSNRTEARVCHYWARCKGVSCCVCVVSHSFWSLQPPQLEVLSGMCVCRCVYCYHHSILCHGYSSRPARRAALGLGLTRAGGCLCTAWHLRVATGIALCSAARAELHVGKTSTGSSCAAADRSRARCTRRQHSWAGYGVHHRAAWVASMGTAHFGVCCLCTSLGARLLHTTSYAVSAQQLRVMLLHSTLVCSM
jgi:hypothetical protein